MHGNDPSYIDDINRQDFGGFSDWRLPTLKEAMSLMEPAGNQNGLHISSIFDPVQDEIWTHDIYRIRLAV